MSFRNDEKDQRKERKGPKLQELNALRYKFYSKLKSQYLDKLLLEPLKDAFHMPSILLRRATHADVPQLSKLSTKHTQKMFGDFDLGYLIEMSNCSLCQTTRKGDIVAFIATSSTPNIPSIPPMKWSPWIETFYGLYQCNSRNSTFLQLILWHDKYKDRFMEQFLIYLYMNDVRLQHIFVISPPGVKPIPCLTPELFQCLLPSNFGGAVGQKVQKVYMNVRKSLIPKLVIRRTLESDNLDIMPQLDKTAPQLRELYGDFLVSEILRFSSDSRLGLTGLLNEKCRGFVLLSRQICYDTIQQFFEVTMFNGFQKSHKDDHVPKKKKKGIIEEIHVQIPDSITFKADEPENQSEDTKEESAHQSLSENSSFQTLERSEESVHVTDIDEYEKEEESKAQLQLPPLVTPGLYFQAQSSLSRINLRPSEANIKGGLLAHEGGKGTSKIVPYGVPPPIFQNEKPEEPVFCGEGNAVIIEIFMMDEGIDFRLGFDFLEAIFEVAPDVDYCLLSLPSNVPTPPILQHFVRIHHRVGLIFPHELYCIHRHLILGDVIVREAYPGDVMSVMELTSGVEKNRIIRDDFLDSITKKPPNLFSFVLLSENVLVGLCIVSKTGYDTTLLESQFDIDKHLTPSLHPHHAFIKHTIISPSFRKQAQLLFREVQRISSVTCLYYTLYDEDVMKSDEMRMTRISVLQDLSQIAPRQQLQYQPVEKIKSLDAAYVESLEEDYLEPIRILQQFEKGLPFALFFTTNRLSTVPKRNIHTKIVVVGASETALSFIESLIFGTNGNFLYSNIFLVSPHGLPYRQKPHKARDAMLIFTGRYNYRYMIQLGLYASVNIVYGYMTAINREEKEIVIDYNKILPYDFLFLFCGLQFTKPLPHTLQKDKYHLSGSQNTKYVQKYLDEYPTNMFLVRSVVDAGHALVTIHKLIKEDLNPEARIVVYGHTLQALAVVNGLLLFGVNPKIIAFVESFPSQPAVTLFNNVAIDNAVLKSITNAGVELYTNCHFSRWESNRSENIIKKIIFESVTKTIIIDCICLFAFDFKCVDFRTFFSTITAGLVFDGRLVIDKNFGTNDPFIYAAGPLTKYKRRYFAEHLNHEYYNSSEIGAKLFSIVQKKLDPNSYLEEFEGNTESEEEKMKRLEMEEVAEQNGIVDLPEFSKPKIQFCHLPGGWNYLHVTTPGIATPLECQLNNPSESGPVYITGDCEDENGPGYFRLAFNAVNQVCEITCYTKQDLEVNNLVKLYDKHIALLNNIYQRFTLGTVPDLFEYFRQSWTCAIYHDRFEAVENKETELFYEQNANSSTGPFIDVITDLLEENFYSPLNEDENDYLRDEFYKTGIVEGIQKTIKEYLVESKFQLPMYISDEYIIVQTESVKGRHLHSKPEVGITREDLLRFKEEDERKEEEEEENKEGGEEGDRFSRISYEEEEDSTEKADIEEESLEEESDEDRPHVIFEPKKSIPSLYPRPPQEIGTMTEKGGFCVLSSLGLHKDLKKCKYCHKYIPETDEQHSLIHIKERRNEKEEEQQPFVAITIEEPKSHRESISSSVETEDTSLGFETSFSMHSDVDGLSNLEQDRISKFDSSERLSHPQHERDTLNSLQVQYTRNVEEKQHRLSTSSGKKSYDLKSKELVKNGSSSKSSIKGRTSLLNLESSVLNIKEVDPSKEVLVRTVSSEIRKTMKEESLENQKRRVFDKITKSWLRYYQ